MRPRRAGGSQQRQGDVGGDGPGVAGNIVSAAATGLIAARAIVHRHTQGGSP